MAPSEFWGMTLSEFWQLHELKCPPKQVGGMSEDLFQELYKRLD